MHAVVVALSELHESVFADHMTGTFGLLRGPRDAPLDMIGGLGRPVVEVVGEKRSTLRR